MYIIFAEFGIIRTFGLSVCIVVGPKQNLWCIKCTGALLMYAAVAIIPVTSSLSQKRLIFHGV